MAERKKNKAAEDLDSEMLRMKSKFEVYGEEMVEKLVKGSGNSGRVYLPPDWVGKVVKIIRID
jgi:putative transposon-encoded protein